MVKNKDFLIIRLAAFILLLLGSGLVASFFILVGLALLLMVMTLIVMILSYIWRPALIVLAVLLVLPIPVAYVIAAFKNRREDFTSFRKQYLNFLWEFPKGLLTFLCQEALELGRELRKFLWDGWTWVQVGGKWGRYRGVRQPPP